MPTIHERHGLHRRPRRPLSARRGRAAAVVLLAAATVAPLLGSSAVAAPGSRTYDQQAYLKAESTGVEERHGWSVDLQGDTAVVGAPSSWYLADDEKKAGKVTVYVRQGSTWELQQTLLPSDSTLGDEFGFSVALEGDTLVIGAPKAGTRGAAYVFTRNDGVWTQQAIIEGTSDGGTEFGTSVDIDGATLVVGAIKGSTTEGGAISVFTGSGASWTRQAVLTASNADSNDQLGTSVAIDGDTVVGGAYLERSSDGTDPANNDLTFAGAAYVFVRSEGIWAEQAYLKAPSPAASAKFGNDVAIEGDTVLVGEPGRALPVVAPTATTAGAVHVFTRADSTWSHRTTLTASDTVRKGNFGSRVALQDGTAAIGRQSGYSDGGGIYLFVGAGAAWAEEAIVRGRNAEAPDQNGTAVAIDGETILFGAYREASNVTGVDLDGPTKDADDDSLENPGAAYILVSSDWSAPTEAAPAVATSLLSLGAPVAPATPGSVLRAPVTGGDPGIDILWRLRDADGQVVAEGPVTLDDAGNGTIELTLPSGLVGSMTLELVDWGVTATFDVTGPVPTSVRAGEGPAPSSWLLATLLAAAGTFALGVRRIGVSPRG